MTRRVGKDKGIESTRRHIGDLAMERQFGYLNTDYINSNVVDHEHKVVFMLNCKSAATSIKRAANLTKQPHEWRSTLYVHEECRDYLKITFVRNPWERLVSCWRSMVCKKLHRTFHLFGITRETPWEEFVHIVVETPDRVADKHFRGQYAHLTHEGVYLPDFTGRVENIREDWALARELVAARGRNVADIGHCNRSPARIPRPQYTPEVAELVFQRYRLDFHHLYPELPRTPIP